jgi:hypothetical protein
MEFYRYQNLFEENGKTAKQEYGDINPPVEMEERYLHGSFVGLISVACV